MLGACTAIVRAQMSSRLHNGARKTTFVRLRYVVATAAETARLPRFRRRTGEHRGGVFTRRDPVPVSPAGTATVRNGVNAYFWTADRCDRSCSRHRVVPVTHAHDRADCDLVTRPMDVRSGG